MIVRILKGSSSFSAVGYNEERVKNGEGQLLCSNNFGSTANVLFTKPSDYKNYLKDWSSRNSRIKSPQLHVTISCKDKSYNPEELKEIGIKWLEKMGYGSNPYMIYFHSNTKNNHIHIITSRIDGQGRKINDSYEKERSVRILDSIIGLDRYALLRKEIAKALKYSYTSEKQFCLILESRGFRVFDSGKSLKILSGGENVEIDKELINFCMNKYRHELTKQEKSKLYALIKKYSTILPKDEFSEFMKMKFGLNFIYMGKKDSPYGYCIVDDANKRVYKGSEICSLKLLLSNLERNKEIDVEIEVLLKDYFYRNRYANSKELNHMLGKYRMKYYDGKIINKYTKETKLVMPRAFNEFIAYNNKLRYVSNVYNPQTNGEYEYLSKRFVIKIEDLKRIGCKSSVNDNSYYKELIEEILKLNGNLRDELNSLGISVRKVGQEFIFIDDDRDVVYSNERIGLNYSLLEESMTLDVPVRFYDNDEFATNNNEELIDVIDSLSDMIYVNTSMGGGDNPKKRRRR
ncbi:MAG: relaxase/mobilization nuclease domain-containing protein [Alphaproteobacteria bacterium]|nr:relaxase/mobilization nuclease domain-containing protein [Alphaproteobacteria bacterium]MBQ2937224.1 relaxase/mobilization nuclease domain-containing protein [Lachnospiraceae bacterium]